jgi:hypothetical protein
MLTGFLVMLWSAIHSGDAPMTQQASKIETGQVYKDGGGGRWRVARGPHGGICGEETIVLRNADRPTQTKMAIAAEVLRQYYTAERAAA